MADSAPVTTYAKKPAYGFETPAKPKVTRAPAPSSRPSKRPKPASIASMPGNKSKKPMDPMEIARMVKLMGSVAGHAR